MIKSWWDDLPPHFKICDDPFQPDGYKLVEKSVSSNYLGPFSTVHLLTAIIASSILQPHAMPASESAATVETIQIVREKLVSLALNSCKVLVYALNDNWVPQVNEIPTCRDLTIFPK